jgi:hypothetical protein
MVGSWINTLAVALVLAGAFGLIYLGIEERRTFALAPAPAFWTCVLAVLLGGALIFGYAWGGSFSGELRKISHGSSRRTSILEVRTAAGDRDFHIERRYEGACQVGDRLTKAARTFDVWCNDHYARLAADKSVVGVAFALFVAALACGLRWNLRRQWAVRAVRR